MFCDVSANLRAVMLASERIGASAV